MSHPDYREPRDSDELAAAIQLFLARAFRYRVVAAPKGGMIVILAGCGFGDAAIAVSDAEAWPQGYASATNESVRGDAMKRDGDLNGDTWRAGRPSGATDPPGGPRPAGIDHPDLPGPRDRRHAPDPSVGRLPGR